MSNCSNHNISRNLSAIGLFLSLAACGGGGGTSGGTTTPSPGPGTGATLSSIVVAPQNPVLKVGASLQMSAVGTYSDGGQANVSGSVTWTASGGAVTVNNGGVVTAVSPGSSIVSAIGTAPSAYGYTFVYTSTYGVEGTAAAPMALTVDTPHAGEVNDGGPAAGYSYYAVNVTPGASYYVFLTGLTGDARLELYDDSGFSHKVCASENYGTADEVCYAAGPASGILYIAVNGDKTNMTTARGAGYTIAVRSGYKDEGKAAALQLPLNTPYSGQVGRLVWDTVTSSYIMGGTSRYRFTLAPTGRYTVSVTGNLKYMVLDGAGSGVVLCETSYTGTAVGSCSFQAGATTNAAYVIVQGDTATVPVGAGFTVSVIEDHAAYVNEGTAAAPLNLTSPTHQGTVATTSYYSIPVNAQQSVQITATSVDGSLSMYVYDGDATFSSYKCSKSTLTPADLVCKLEPATTGTVYVAMTVNGGVGTQYFLNVTPINYPAQGSAGAPQVLVSAPKYTAPYVGTVDNTTSYYQVPVTAGKLYRVGLANVSGNVSLAVYDNAGLTTSLCTSNVAGLGNESCQATPSGTSLWIKVGGSSYGSKYDLTVDRVYKQQGNLATPFDITGSLPTYTGGETGTGTSGTERSHLKVNLTAGKAYAFTVTNNTDPNLSTWVFDNSGYSWPTVCQAEPYNGFTCTVKPLYTGTAYIWMTSNAPYGSGFDLSINEVGFNTQGSVGTPVNIGSFPAPESVGVSPLQYTGGEVNGANSYYVADVSGGRAYVKFTVSLTKQSANVDLYVYDDASFTNLLCSSVNGSTTNETCANLSPSGTNLYIRVSGASNGFGGTFNLTVDHDYVSEGAPVTANGNQPILAFPLLQGVPHLGEAQGTTPSYYYLSGFMAGSHTVTVSNLFDSTCVYVYDEADGRFSTGYVAFNNNNGLTPDRTFTRTFTNGVFLMIQGCGYSNTGTAYTVTIN